MQASSWLENALCSAPGQLWQFDELFGRPAIDPAVRSFWQWFMLGGEWIHDSALKNPSRIPAALTSFLHTRIPPA